VTRPTCWNSREKGPSRGGGSFHAFLDQPHDLPGVGLLREAERLQFLAEDLDGEGRAREVLSEVVVQLAADAGPFALADSSRIFFQAFALGDLGR